MDAHRRGTMPACISSTDPRSLRTRSALRAALAQEIVHAGDLTRVTVTAVTDRAEVTRRTFYSHYKDIPDMVARVEEEAIEELRGLVGTIAATHLDELESAIQCFEPCPGSIELLTYFKEHSLCFGALLGEGGDPAFAEKLKVMVRDVVADRAAQGLNTKALGSIFDYYLTFVISAEVGVLVRWLATGTKESPAMMARLMTALAFVRPGDLYGHTIRFDVPEVALAILGGSKGDNNE